MDITLRQIADAVFKTRDRQTGKEHQRIYNRARMLRDEGYILSTTSRTQGKTTTFTEADTAAAVVALTANLNGMSFGIIGALNSDLRAIDNTAGRPEFERYIDDIKSGKPVYIRLDILTEPSSHTVATMGDDKILSIKMTEGTTQVLIWPVTMLAKPVLEILAAD